MRHGTILVAEHPVGLTKDGNMISIGLDLHDIKKKINNVKKDMVETRVEVNALKKEIRGLRNELRELRECQPGGQTFLR